jgi:Na+-transporting NADH:ubiquinone oxidoreductase subunit NqrB
MAIIEIVAGSVVVTAVMLAIGAAIVGWDRLAAWRHDQTTEGRMERKGWK